MIYDRGWKTPPASLKLLDDEVHVWRISLLQSESTLHDLEQVLGIEEVTRAKRFVFEKERNRLITSHGCLRMLLGHYLNTEPNLLRFSTNAYGKPFLDLPSQRHTLHFNFSHSHNLALYAFAYARQLGIDVEYMRSDIEYEELAKHFFSSVENTQFEVLPVKVKQQAFYDCWTRKEAYIKARGRGLSLPLDLFDVSLRPGEPAALLSSREDPQETTRWTFRALDAGPGYAGALAVEGDGWKLHCWQWQQV